MTEESKSIIKEILTKVLEDLKDNAAQYVKDEILPAAKEAKDEFITKLKDESDKTSSAWVKVRNLGIAVILNVLGGLVSKAIDSLIEEN